PAALHDTADSARTARRAARLLLAVIDGKGMLEVAERAVGANMVAQGRAARLDGVGDHLADRLRQEDEFLLRLARRRHQRSGQPLRREVRSPQRLADIDVAETGNVLLVEQRGL